MLLVALLVREEIGLIVSAFGLYLVLVHRAWLWGAPIAIGGFAFTAVTALVIIPAFGNAAAGDYLYLDRYGYWGDSVPEIAQSLVSNPLLVLENLLVPDKMTFAALLFVPLGLMSLLGADLLLLALPTLGYILLSNDFAQYDISSQYHAPLAPALFAAAIIGGSRLAARGSRLASRAETLTAGAGVCDGRARRLPGRLSDVRRRARIANRLAGHLRDHRPRPTPSRDHPPDSERSLGCRPGSSGLPPFAAGVHLPLPLGQFTRSRVRPDSARLHSGRSNQPSHLAVSIPGVPGFGDRRVGRLGRVCQDDRRRRLPASATLSIAERSDNLAPPLSFLARAQNPSLRLLLGVIDLPAGTEIPKEIETIDTCAVAVVPLHPVGIVTHRHNHGGTSARFDHKPVRPTLRLAPRTGTSMPQKRPPIDAHVAIVPGNAQLVVADLFEFDRLRDHDIFPTTNSVPQSVFRQRVERLPYPRQ